MNAGDLSRLISAACKGKPDFVIRDARVINVFTNEVAQTNVAISGDTEAAAPYCAALRELTRDRMPVLERFLNHASVDSLDACFAVADLSVRAKDVCAAVEALAEARSVLERIEGIELFSWNNLL